MDFSSGLPGCGAVAAWKRRALGLGAAIALGAAAHGVAAPYYWSSYPTAEARLFFATGVAVDGGGNVYASLVADHYVAKIDLAGAVSVMAGVPGTSGTTDGPGDRARFNAPQGIAVDGAGVIYLAEFGSSTIRRISPAGVVTTLAGMAGARDNRDGLLANARFNAPRGIAVDGNDFLYVADTTNCRVRMITPFGTVQTVAGSSYGHQDGVGTIARFMAPWGIACDRAGNLFVTDSVAHTVRKVPAQVGFTSTLAGTPGVAGSDDGRGGAARFSQPTGIAVDEAGTLFVTDTQNRTVRMIAADGVVSTIGGQAGVAAGADSGIGGAARFIAPYAVAVAKSGVLYVADYLGVRRGEAVRAPVIMTQPVAVRVRAGMAAKLTVTANGVPPPTYQWRRNGERVVGATGESFTLANAQFEHDGDYTVEVTNALGTLVSATVRLTVDAPPVISAAPRPATIGADGSARLAVTVTGVGPFTYQWLREGRAIAGATEAALRAVDYGNYSVVVTNAFGATTTSPVLVEFPGRLANLSAASAVSPQAGQLTAGFVVAAPEGARKRLLVRAVGPALRQFGVTDALPQTLVTLRDDRGATMARNSGWATNPLDSYAAISAAAPGVGAFELPPGSGDSALIAEVPRGNYTATAEAADAGQSGSVLVEIYELGADAARLANLSVRGQVSASAPTLTIGFVAYGSASPNVLVRAVGPGLERFGVAGALPQLTLTVTEGARPLATNRGWTTNADIGQIEGAAAAAGAFPLARDAADCALLLSILPGHSFTAHVNGIAGSSGAVLIEVYQVF